MAIVTSTDAPTLALLQSGQNVGQLGLGQSGYLLDHWLFNTALSGAQQTQLTNNLQVDTTGSGSTGASGSDSSTATLTAPAMIRFTVTGSSTVMEILRPA